MHWIIEILAAIFAILSVILIHELGHFTVAKLLGVKVLRFSIGFGKSLIKYHAKSGTEYVLAMLPLGGYVKLLNQNDLETYKDMGAKCYEDQPIWKRILILLAGPFSNFLLACVLIWLVFVIGFKYVEPMIGEIKPNTLAYQIGLKPGDEIVKIKHKSVYGWQDVVMNLIASIGDQKSIDITVKRSGAFKDFFLPLNNLVMNNRQFDILDAAGIVPFVPLGPAEIIQVAAHSPADRAGLQSGDVVKNIANRPVNNWYEAQKIIHQYPNTSVEITFDRQGKVITLPIKLAKENNENNENEKVGYLGVAFKVPAWPPNLIKTRNSSIITAWPPAVSEVYDLIYFNVKVLIKMLEGQISLSGLSGPVGIIQTAGVASQAGLDTYLTFIALISVALGFLNLLPIPLLDGGHLFFELIEFFIQKKISLAAKKIIWSISLTLLLFLVIYATYNDLLQIL